MDNKNTSVPHTLLSKISHHTSGRTIGPCVQQAPVTADLQRNRVSNLESSGSEAETLPLGHRGSSDLRITFKMIISMNFPEFTIHFNAITSLDLLLQMKIV
ncbi:hypothetical protein AVEN_103562-1 [Araneus ventricosus]|uniref:Uncharacterized protein n=1 Tax=Araneus ventricosus TaxID=182803 RepID=A0A4Y2G572_ARAVE|nr:hypothetical protein AVEN_103562-1 [Araneus ventricosus]